MDKHLEIYSYEDKETSFHKINNNLTVHEIGKNLKVSIAWIPYLYIFYFQVNEIKIIPLP